MKEILCQQLFCPKKAILVLFGICILVLGASTVSAAERGIGVSPSSIEAQDVQEWPYTKTLFVMNYSADEEWIEVTVQKETDHNISIEPARFALESGERGVVEVVMDGVEGEAKGLLRVSASRTSPEGLATGTGVKIPYHVSGERGATASSGLAANILEAVGSTGWPLLILIVALALYGIWRVSVVFARQFASPVKAQNNNQSGIEQRYNSPNHE